MDCSVGRVRRNPSQPPLPIHVPRCNKNRELSQHRPTGSIQVARHSVEARPSVVASSSTSTLTHNCIRVHSDALEHPHSTTIACHAWNRRAFCLVKTACGTRRTPLDVSIPFLGDTTPFARPIHRDLSSGIRDLSPNYRYHLPWISIGRCHVSFRHRRHRVASSSALRASSCDARRWLQSCGCVETFDWTTILPLQPRMRPVERCCRCSCGLRKRKDSSNQERTTAGGCIAA